MKTAFIPGMNISVSMDYDTVDQMEKDLEEMIRAATERLTALAEEKLTGKTHAQYVDCLYNSWLFYESEKEDFSLSTGEWIGEERSVIDFELALAVFPKAVASIHDDDDICGRSYDLDLVFRSIKKTKEVIAALLLGNIRGFMYEKAYHKKFFREFFQKSNIGKRIEIPEDQLPEICGGLHEIVKEFNRFEALVAESIDYLKCNYLYELSAHIDRHKHEKLMKIIEERCFTYADNI